MKIWKDPQNVQSSKSIWMNRNQFFIANFVIYPSQNKLQVSVKIHFKNARLLVLLLTKTVHYL